MENTIYDAAFFINKFEAIPEELWAKGTFEDGYGRRCAQGHCGMTASNCGDLWKSDDVSIEAVALVHLLEGKFGFDAVSAINRGGHCKFQKETPKLRILSALRELQNQELAQN